jgi:peptidyl-tRNA hydrolase, PTH1 family
VATQQDNTRIVVGLGNPGAKYARTRHNVGFMAAEALRRRWNMPPGRRGFQGVVYEARDVPRLGVRRVLLQEPHTYMNLSGGAVLELATFYKVAPADVLVVLDDLALPLGQLRARADGSAGGHKGLIDVIRALGTDRVPRLRIGIGPQPAMMDSVDFVLQTFSPVEQKIIDEAADKAAEAVEQWIENGITYVMDRYNRKGPTQDQTP